MNVFVTDYGVVNTGPVVQAEIERLAPALAASKRTKRYKEAKVELTRLEQCINTLHKLYWIQELDFDFTP